MPSENVIKDALALELGDRSVDNAAAASKYTNRVRMTLVAAMVPGGDLFTTDMTDVIGHCLILHKEKSRWKSTSVVSYHIIGLFSSWHKKLLPVKAGVFGRKPNDPSREPSPERLHDG